MSAIETRLTALEQEVQSLRDQAAIQQLILGYGPLVDTATTPDRARKVAELWTEDGTYDVGGMRFFAGREELSELCGEQHFQQAAQGICHVMGAPVVTVTGDEAVAFNYSCVFCHDGAGNFFAWRVSANRWDIVRREGRWEVARRVNRPMNGNPEALSLLRQIDNMGG